MQLRGFETNDDEDQKLGEIVHFVRVPKSKLLKPVVWINNKLLKLYLLVDYYVCKDEPFTFDEVLKKDK